MLLLFAVDAASARPHSVDPLDWLIQHICADSADQPIAFDPYDGCKAGLRERRLGLDDPMPYLRHDQPGKDGDHPDGFQRLDSHPIIDVHTKAIVAANDFDFDYIEPYGSMHPGDGDGFDVYRVAGGYATSGGTRDGGGYSQTFFGPDCKPYGGWVFFPVSFLRSLANGAAGRGIFAIRGVYWEQNGEPWPGTCRPGQGFSWDTLTTWEFAPTHPFGGVNGAVTKHIDAIVSTHGLPIQRGGPQSQFHLERFYFTDLYGLTRWEAWVPSSDRVKATERCAGDTQMTYEGLSFTLGDCRDWSVVQLFHPPRIRWPWPYPEANLLQNWHFDHERITPWQRTGATSGPGSVKLDRFISRAPADLRLSQTHIGVRHLQLVCGMKPCAPDDALYQDIPVASLPPSSSYDYGFSGVIDGTQNGTMTVRLSELDQNGEQLWSTSFDATVKTDYRGVKVADSAYNASSVFLTTSPPMTLKPAATTLRFSLLPRTPALYDILDTWLMPRWQ